MTAARQTRGRGRLRRRWDSGPGGLYLTLLLRPSLPPERLADCGRRAGEAVARAVARQGVLAAVKAPNDVLACAASGPLRGAPGTMKRRRRGGPLRGAPGTMKRRRRGGPRRFRKVAGILAEAASTGTRTDWLLLGVGVNANNRPASAGAASLAELLGEPVDLGRLLAEVLEELERSLKEWL